MAAESEYCQIFDNLSAKFSCLIYATGEKQQQYIISLLNDLNSLNYRLPVVTNNNKAVLLIHQFCSIIPASDKILVEKCCTLIVNLVSVQRVVIEGPTLTFAIQWIIQILKQTQIPNIAVLQCLESLIRDNVEKIQELLPELIDSNGLLIKLCDRNVVQEVRFWAVKCLEAVVYCKDEQNIKNYQISVGYLEIIAGIFLRLLQEEKKCDDEVIYSKLLNSSLRGLQCIILQTTNFECYDLGVFLGISRCYMTYCLYNSEWVQPQKIMPSNFSVADLKTSVIRDKKGGKVTKQRKQRKSNSHKREENNKRAENVNTNLTTDTVYTPATTFAESTNVIISDSDFSDSESGKKSKLTVTQGRVRQAALNLLLSIVKVTDKHVIFGYWSSFFSDGSPSGIHSLNQCLLHEPSPRGRIAVLNVISIVLNGSKLFLSQAEYSEKTFAFTPFSLILGSVVQELHKCLCQALKDNSIPVLTQTLKCLALLVQATPYHRLSPGLVIDIITHVRPFIRHRDATIQVAALIVFGCLLVSESAVQETTPSFTQTIQNAVPNLVSNIKRTELNEDTNFQLHKKKLDVDSRKVNSPAVKLGINSLQEDEIQPNVEFAEFSSDEDDESHSTESSSDLPWLLEKCLRNLGVLPLLKRSENVPAPIKLESLQVLSVMCRNHFSMLLAPHIILVVKAVEFALLDKYMDLRLHAGRAVELIGQAMQQHIAATDAPKTLSVDKGIQFWQILLSGPLTALLQCETHATLRAVGCDALGSIGSDIFEYLPKDKQLLIISMLFACSRDEEKNVKGAAVRALAISVMYPTLREDLGFVMDTAEAIIRTLDDPNLTVKIKSSWSLGNLSDALVLYKNNPTNEELPDSLILKLLRASIQIADDNNKIKSNAARALGNLLRLVNSDLFKADNCVDTTEKAIAVLVKNSTTCSDVKVRWNSCYAIGNFMKNNDLFVGSTSWQANVYSALTDLVINFRNFKVRINAALALSVPEKRSHYGNQYFSIWRALLKALDNSQNIEDISEFKHRDNLIDQICLSLCHLINFLTVDDLNPINELLMYHIDTLKTQMRRVQERLVPEKAEIVIRASDHVSSLHKEHLSKEETSVVILLQNIFINDNFM